MSATETFGQNATGEQLDELCVNTLRTLAIDAIQKANCGHPGLPMGAADFAYVLWTQFLKVDPATPDWPDRDRFVLSAGHGSMLLYSLLHLAGFDLSLDEIKNFRQLGSRTPGHPEFGLTPGVESTTGPLGQGIGNAIGMAIAEAWLAANMNTPAADIVDHRTYVLCGDGDLMEGVAAEAVSLAGHLRLGKLIMFYDDNHISIEGDTDLAYTDDAEQRFAGYNWHVQRIDGHDRAAIAEALRAAQDESDRPSLIIGRTTIGFGSPNKAGTSGVHGSPLGADEIILTKKNLGWPEDEHFLVPDAARERFSAIGHRGGELQSAWTERLAAWKAATPDKAELWDRCHSGDVPEELIAELPVHETGGSMATRKSAGAALEVAMRHMPGLIGGSADLAPSTNTYVKAYGSFSAESRGARNLHFGIREHAMGAALNGMSYHGGVRGFGATFLVFSDYMRPSIRLAALSGLNPIYVFTHDSIFLGEDGPTHQSVEHFAALRTIPNLTVIRPADANESSWAWAAALRNTSGPTALCLTRQGLPVLDGSKSEGLLKGGYVLAGEGDVTLIATGSEVHVALEARELLAAKGVAARVVSMPSWELFDLQDESYRAEALGEGGRRVAIEAGVRQGWDRYLGDGGLFIGLDGFGESAPAEDLARHFGLTGEAAAERIADWLK